MSYKVYSCPNCDFQLPREQPIISYGIIGVKVTVPEITQDQLFQLLNSPVLYKNSQTTEGIQTMENRVKFLLVRRRSSLGLSSIVRGKYNNTNLYSIIKLIRQLTQEDLEKLQNMEFYDLWRDVCGVVQHKPFTKSYEKFKKLFDTKEPINIKYYLNRYKPLYKTQEWGIPKGRKTRDETPLECACREFMEETGINSDSFRVLDSICPKTEEFKASDGKIYRHVYFTCLITGNNIEGEVDTREIGDKKWVDLPEALSLVRHDKYDRAHIITTTYCTIANTLYKEGIR